MSSQPANERKVRAADLRRPPRGDLPPLTLNAWHRWDIIRSVIEDRHPSTILEVGCGRGAMGARMAEAATYVGVEPDEESAAAARHTMALTRSALVVSDLHDVPDNGSGYDMVCAFEVLEHVEDDVGALRDWAERLAEGGFVLLSVPAHRDRFGPSDKWVGHLRRYDRTDLEELVRAAGLEPGSIWSTGWPVGHLLEWAWHRAARRKVAADTSAAERTAASGRWLQPGNRDGMVRRLASVPGRQLQRLRFDSDAGVGWVVMCER